MMKFFSDKLLRWIGGVFLILAIYFLASAFYIPVKAMIGQSFAGETNGKPGSSVAPIYGIK